MPGMSPSREFPKLVGRITEEHAGALSDREHSAAERSLDAMNTKTFLLALGAATSLPLMSFAQSAGASTSPTSSADGGAQHTTMPSDANAAGPTNGPATDAPHLSSTNTQTGGAVDTGTPRDNADKNMNVDHQTATETSTTNK